MRSFKHYILTRFNIDLYGRAAERGLVPEQWMEHRIRLFETITVPSIAGQSCQDFTWLILMDHRTPASDLRRIESLCAANMRLVFPVPKQHWWLPHLEQGPYDLITTRIDNDDAFHRDVVETIQATWRAHEQDKSKPWVIVFPFGLIMDLADRRGWLMEYWVNNCPSLIEDGQDPRSVWAWDHSQIPREVTKHYIKDKPYWLQVIHSQNLRNAIETNNPLRIVHRDVPAKLEHLRLFGLDPNALPAAR